MKLQATLGWAAYVTAGSHNHNGPEVRVEAGIVTGSRVELPGGAPVNKFLGIPYGEVPARFELPRQAIPWDEPFNATEFGPSCLQHYVTGPLAPSLDVIKDLFGPEVPSSEDCLSVNAFTPETPGPLQGRPVVVVIPGGGFQQGNGLVDLSGFAAYEDVVAFAFNYRTNIFGFPNAGDIPLGERNLGIYDQRLALDWVQRNAKAFGGDPSRVTIWGESAGAISVDIHMTAFADADPAPFHAGMMYSGQMSWGYLGSTAAANDSSSWNSLSEAIGCPGQAGEVQMSCMKAANATLMLDKMRELQLAFMPFTDGTTIPRHRAQRWRDGKVAQVPIMVGTIAQEGRTLVSRNASVEMFLQAYLPESLVPPQQRDDIVSFYRGLPEIKTDFDLTSQIYTDFLWQCPQMLLSQASSDSGIPTWRFYFNQSVTDIFPDGFEYLEKAHGSDVALLFGTPTFEGDANGMPLTPQLYTFAKSFRSMTGQFIRNPLGGPGWPSVGSRYEPFDVVSLGDLGDVSTSGATPVNQTALDSRCGLYENLYPVLEKYVLQ